MSPEAAIAERIVALATSAGTRVYQLRLPQSATFPAVRVQLITGRRFPHLRGGGADLRMALIQVDSYARESSGADPYEAVTTLAGEINGDDAGSGLSGWAGESPGSPGLQITGVLPNGEARPMYEAEDLRLVRMMQEFQVWYRPA